MIWRRIWGLAHWRTTLESCILPSCVPSTQPVCGCTTETSLENFCLPAQLLCRYSGWNSEFPLEMLSKGFQRLTGKLGSSYCGLQDAGQKQQWWKNKVRVNSVTAWTPFSVWCLHRPWVMEFSLPRALFDRYFTPTSVFSSSRLVPCSVVSGRAAERPHWGQDGPVPARGGKHPWVNPPLQLNGLLKQSLCWWGFANQAMGANHWHHC